MSETDNTVSHISSIINEYLKLDNEIKELKKAIRERQYKQKAAEQSILTFMNEEGNIDSIKISNNSQEIVPVQREQVKQASRKNLMEIVETTLKNQPELLKKINDELNSKKTVSKIEKIQLKKMKTTTAKASNVKANSALTDALLSNI